MRKSLAVLAAAVVLAGCTSDPEPKPAPTSSAFDRDDFDEQMQDQRDQTQAALDELADKVEVRGEAAKNSTAVITIVDGKVTPTGGRVEVKAGQKITLTVISDAADELHVHSNHERFFKAVAGQDPQVFTFTVETPGQVAVELQDLDVTVLQLVVR